MDDILCWQVAGVPGVVSNSGDRTLETFAGAEIRSGGGASDTSLMPTMNNLNRG